MRTATREEVIQKYNHLLLDVFHIRDGSVPRMSKKMATNSKFNLGYRHACEVIRRRIRNIIRNADFIREDLAPQAPRTKKGANHEQEL